MSKILRSQLTIDDHQAMVMDKQYLKDYVTDRLLHEMRPALLNEMLIKNIGNPNTGTNTYTGTLTVGASTISGYNYNSAITNSSSTIPESELRVVEFTKNGKVTKVELQRYTEDGWRRIPRIQIEDKS